MTGTFYGETKILDVTQDDIDQGVRHSARDCPFARAARRLFGRWPHPVVSVGHISIGVVQDNAADSVFSRWSLDWPGTAAVMAYDAGERMLPGQYTLTRQA